MSLYRLNEGSNPEKSLLKKLAGEDFNHAFKHNPKKKMSWKNLNIIDKGFRHDTNKPYSWKNIDKKFTLAKLALTGASVYGIHKLSKRLDK